MQIEKARLLIQQNRFELAEKELRGALASAPDDAQVHALLAVCLGALDRKAEALEEAKRAVQCGPQSSFTHYVLSGAYDQVDRLPEAGTAIREAIRLDPEDADYRARLSNLHLQQRQWEPALAAAEQGLALDPENSDCLNYRTVALNKLGRKDEARAASRGALGTNPDDSATHASAGWHEIEHGHHEAALEHFREALRLDSSQSWAREGIVEAMKARNPLYRLMLRYFMFMSRLQGRVLWGLLIGGYVLSKVLRNYASANPEWKPLILPILGVYFAFCLMTWVADPLFNLLLRLDPVGRVALTPGQTRAANWFGALLLAALAAAAWWWVVGVAAFGWAALALALLVIPVSTALAMEQQRHRRVLVAYSAVLAVAGAVMVAASLLLEPKSLAFTLSFLVLLVGVVTFGWVANWLQIRS